MTIFLMVVKVIGWILLVAVMLILLAAALILFVPIRYRVRAGSDKMVPELFQSFSLEGRASWLLRLVEARGDFHGTEGSAVLRILWLRRVLYPQETEEYESPEAGGDEPGSPRKSESAGAGERESGITEGDWSEPTGEDEPEPAGRSALEESGVNEPVVAGKEEPGSFGKSVSAVTGGGIGEDEPGSPGKSVSEEAEERESAVTGGDEAKPTGTSRSSADKGNESVGADAGKQGSSAKSAQEFIRSDQYSDDEDEKPDEGIFSRKAGPVHRMILKGKRILEDIKGRGKKVKRVWEDDRNQRAFSHLLREVRYLYRHSHPRKCRIQLSFSAGAPDRTGLLFGIMAMYPTAYEQHWQVEPDFNEEKIYIDGEVVLVGRIRLIHVFAVVLRVIFDLDCRRMKAMVDRLF